MSAILILFLLPASAAPQPRPMADLPSGWLCVEEQSMDTVDFGCHDSASGAFVAVTIGTATTVAPLQEGKDVRTDIRDGVKYRTRVAPSREKGCDDVEMSFLPNGPSGASWTFSGSSCNGQRERIDALAFSQIATMKVWPYRLTPLDVRQTVTPDQATSFEAGASWGSVREALGVPRSVAKREGGGFIVEYEQRLGQPDKLLVLAFSQDQRLIEASRR